MMTNYEIVQVMIALTLWLLTWELFLGQYFYTKSEKEIMKKTRGDGRFTMPTLISTMVTLFVMGTVFFKLVKYF